MNLTFRLTLSFLIVISLAGLTMARGADERLRDSLISPAIPMVLPAALSKLRLV